MTPPRPVTRAGILKAMNRVLREMKKLETFNKRQADVAAEVRAQMRALKVDRTSASSGSTPPRLWDFGHVTCYSKNTQFPQGRNRKIGRGTVQAECELEIAESFLQQERLAAQIRSLQIKMVKQFGDEKAKKKLEKVISRPTPKRPN